jgi:hypothetical protein
MTNDDSFPHLLRDPGEQPRAARQNSFSSLLLKYTLKSFYKTFLDPATSAGNWTSFGKCPPSATGLCSENARSEELDFAQETAYRMVIM